MKAREFHGLRKGVSLRFAAHYYAADIICKLIGHHWEKVDYGRPAWWNCARCETYSNTNPTAKRHA